MPNKNQHLCAAWPQVQQQQTDCVLATIIETVGSTYQKAGARMLITAQGELLGLLGGGCFEHDLVEQAHSVFATGTPKSVFYDMRAPEDVLWGLGLGCNGAVRVLLQLITAANAYSPLNHLSTGEENGVLITICDSSHSAFPAGHNLFLASADTNSTKLLTTAPFPFATAALQTLLQQKPRLENHVLDDQPLTAFYAPVQAPLKLLVIGAGTDAIPLVHCAKALGWRVSVVDYRPAYLQAERFAAAEQIHPLFPEELSAQLPLDGYQAVVLMTHNVAYDQRYLQALSHCQIPYIGLLGPAARRDRLLQSLGEDARRLSARVYGPVGLDIGAETPEEIALSIMAGIHSDITGRSGKDLSLPQHSSQYA